MIIFTNTYTIILSWCILTVASEESSCDKGQWGINCTSTCPAFCTSNGCEKKTGFCYGCLSGFQGKYCDIPCPLNCIHCDQYNGECYTSCTINCATCTSSTGTCLHCKPGWYGKECELPCFSGCAAGHCTKSNGNCIRFRNGTGRSANNNARLFSAHVLKVLAIVNIVFQDFEVKIVGLNV
jgi:hypothetical protein